MGGKKRSARSKRNKTKKFRLHAQDTVKKETRVTKETPNRKWLRAALVAFVVILFLFSGSLLYLNWPFAARNESSKAPEQPDQPNVTVPRAAIVDGLYNTEPNSTFTENLMNVLVEAGFQVDLLQGESVTIDLLRNIGGYKLIILRLHSSIHTDRWLYLFSGEPYTEYKYVTEQLSGAVRKAYTFDEDETPYFAMNSVFLGINNPKGLNGSTIILMGCNGTNDSYSIQSFFERGAKAYVAWNGYVDLSYSDEVILGLVKVLYSDGLNLKEAVEKVMKDIGPDPLYTSSLEYYAPG